MNLDLALIKEIEAWRTRYACNQNCNLNDGPDEECAAHGRTPEDLWAIIGKMSDDQRVGMARIEQLEAAIQEARNEHRRIGQGRDATCSLCGMKGFLYGDFDYGRWPCPTIQALGEPDE